MFTNIDYGDSEEEVKLMRKLWKFSDMSEEIIDKHTPFQRVYISDPSEAPEGVKVHTGIRGGLYYDVGKPKHYTEEEARKKPWRVSVPEWAEITPTIQTALDNGYKKIKEAGLDKEINNVATLLKQGKTSKNQNFVNGQYTSERQVLHKQIVDSFIGAGSISEHPEVILVGGPTASGKTTLLRNKGINFSNYVSVNNDDIKSKLPGYNGINAALYHDEARDILHELIKKSIYEKRNIIIDGTMREFENEHKKIDVFKFMDYKVRIISLTAKPEITIQRATRRFLEEKRYVPLEHIAKTSRKINEVQSKYKELADEYELWNSDEFPPKRIV